MQEFRLSEHAMKKEWTAEERAAVEARYKAELTAADLQQYTEEIQGVPFAEVLAELETRQREWAEKKR
jgi:hypothetical protein